jgi:hypothetical protein
MVFIISLVLIYTLYFTVKEVCIKTLTRAAFFFFSVMLEAMKCLCNIIFQSPRAQVLSCKNNSLEGVVMRLQTYKDPELPYEIKFFNMRILFLITALLKDITPQLKSKLPIYLTDTLDLILKEAGGEAYGDERGATSSDIKITLSVSTLLMFKFASYLGQVSN